MDKREKVIKGLECCSIGLYCPDEECPYEKDKEEKQKNCIALLARDALELLKAQEARVMTLDEVKEIGRFEFDNTDRSKETVVWFEKRNGNSFNGRLAPSRIEYCYHPEYGDDEYCDSVTQYVSGSEVTSRLHCGVYGKYWRCWTQRPTDEQREKVKWNG